MEKTKYITISITDGESTLLETEKMPCLDPMSGDPISEMTLAKKVIDVLSDRFVMGDE